MGESLFETRKDAIKGGWTVASLSDQGVFQGLQYMLYGFALSGFERGLFSFQLRRYFCVPARCLFQCFPSCFVWAALSPPAPGRGSVVASVVNWF